MAKRVFFSFHYDDVEMFRANVVRKHDMTKETRDDAGFFDASMWESAQRRGDESLKLLINDALDDTSVTAVLIGSDTCNRRWVRYEIFKSIKCGNGLFGIHINQIRDRDRQIKPIGPNPFDYLAVQFAADGTGMRLLEWTNGQWRWYQDLGGWSFSTPRPRSDWGQIKQLSTWYWVYNWVSDDGYNNFADWVEQH